MTPITFGRALQRWSSDGFVVTETLHAPGLRLPMHEHEAANVTIVLRGGFEERVERRSFTAQRGSVIVKPPGARHANVYGTREVECITIEVPASVQLDEARYLEASLFALLAERMQTTLDVEELVHRLTSPRPAARGEGPGVRGWLPTIEALLREENTTSLTNLGAAVNRHPAHVARAFRAQYGCSIGEFVRACRIDQARDALLRSERSIADIALDSGFYDQSHFTNVFRSFLGVTPHRYRAQRSSKTTTRRRP